MTLETNIFKRYKSPQKLREIRNEGLKAISIFRDPRFFIIDSAKIHFFEDCAFVQGEYQMGRLAAKGDEPLRKTITAYSRDLKTWHEYKEQFEPKEGFHLGIEYKPHDESFPTRTW